MDEAGFAEAFDRWVETTGPKCYESLLGPHLPPRVERALDVGCGPGYLALYLAGRADHVVGLDLSGAMTRLARRKRDRVGVGNVSFVTGDVGAPPLRPASFDVVSSDTMLHDTEIEVTLPVLRSLVRPGGWVILRDVTTRHTGRSRSPLWQLAGTIRQVPRYLRELGPRQTWSVLRFEASPTWVRHRAEGGELTREEFRAAYSRVFPDCTFLDEPWAMTAIWRAPT
ncbi:MAG: class I SAM-dependent methyltransferase [Gemmatimonadota bacterium]|nr:class I SAM-dependent methyltransferase [Gemmatimonadota bacterium]